MKPLLWTSILISALTTAECVWSQDKENHWEHYQPRTLQSIIDAHRDFAKDLSSNKKALLLTGDNFPSQVRLIYLVDSRPLPAEQKVLLDSWRKMLKDNAPPQDVFTTQVRFEEDSHEYWIVVQKPLLDGTSKGSIQRTGIKRLLDVDRCDQGGEALGMVVRHE